MNLELKIEYPNKLSFSVRTLMYLHRILVWMRLYGLSEKVLDQISKKQRRSDSKGD